MHFLSFFFSPFFSRLGDRLRCLVELSSTRLTRSMVGFEVKSQHLIALGSGIF